LTTEVGHAGIEGNAGQLGADGHAGIEGKEEHCVPCNVMLNSLKFVTEPEVIVKLNALLKMFVWLLYIVKVMFDCAITVVFELKNVVTLIRLEIKLLTELLNANANALVVISVKLLNIVIVLLFAVITVMLNIGALIIEKL